MTLRCALSHLPITYRTPVVAFLLTGAARSHPGEDTYVPEAYYCVRTPPIRGIYDEYGRFDYEDSPLTALWMDGFAVDGVSSPPTLEGILRTITTQRGEVAPRVRDLHGPETYIVTQAIVRADAWESALAHPPPPFVSTDPAQDVNYYRAKLMDAAASTLRRWNILGRPTEALTRENAEELEREVHDRQVLYDGSYPYVLGLKWHLARALQLRTLGQWFDADVDVVVSAIAEMCAVREVCVSIGRLWLPGNWCCGDRATEELGLTMGREWVRLAEAIQTEREVRRGADKG